MIRIVTTLAKQKLGTAGRSGVITKERGDTNGLLDRIPKIQCIPMIKNVRRCPKQLLPPCDVARLTDAHAHQAVWMTGFSLGQ